MEAVHSLRRATFCSGEFQGIVINNVLARIGEANVVNKRNVCRVRGCESDEIIALSKRGWRYGKAFHLVLASVEQEISYELSVDSQLHLMIGARRKRGHAL